MQYSKKKRRIKKVLSSLWHKEGIQRFIPSKLYVQIEYKSFMGKPLNLKEPKTYNEKIQWLKLYDQKPEYTRFVDKYEVRSFVAETIGEQYLIPLLGIYDSFDEIDFTSLPKEFVIKPTHSSGDIYRCKDKSAINAMELRKLVEAWMKHNYYFDHREWPYKNIKPRIVCEKYLVDESGTDLSDYKFFCFHGEPQFINVISGREKDICLDSFDASFRHIPVVHAHKNNPKKIKKPVGYEKMVELARILSKNFLHVRVDFYNVKGKIYFGELTFYPSAGLRGFEPESYDEAFGNLMVLPMEGAKA